MKIRLYLLLLLLSTAVFAQQKQVVTSIDTIKNKIGAEFKLSIKTTVDSSSRVLFPKSRNFGALEVIQSYPVDTVKIEGRYELTKRYGLTQFDSGRYVIPRFKIFINNQAFLTDSLLVEVANVQVDTLKQKMYDIKDIAPAEESMGNWWKYVLAILVLAGIAILIYWFIKKRQEKKLQEEVFKTPIEKATTLLDTLERKELWQKGEIKAYYSELTDIARNYIEEAIEIPAMESTTSELIQGLRAASVKKKMTLSQDIIENLERVLKQADLVKFAKSKPLDFEIAEDRNKIQKVIVTLDKSIPVELELDQEEFLLNEAQKQKQIALQVRKQKVKRIQTAIASVVFLVTFITAYFIATRGFDFVKDNVLGHPTKELLEGEWVKSEYGNPGIIIETPKVLKRVDLTKSLPKNGMALIKEMQSFTYGSIVDRFYVMVSTLKYKAETQIDLAKSMDGALQSLEAQGAQNMIVKQEEFETPEGVKGIKAYGTFSQLDSQNKTTARMYYEALLFSQEGGLQQILIFHEEGDSYGNEIAEKVLNTVELKQASK